MNHINPEDYRPKKEEAHRLEEAKTTDGSTDAKKSVNRSYEVKLVNLQTGDVLIADPYRLRELGLPDGYQEANSVTTDEWIEALQKALNVE